MSGSLDFPEGPPGTPGFVERRRYERRRVGPDLALTIPTVVNAEVIDISAGGAMVSTPAQVVPGHRCRFRTLLDREPFSASVEVLRVEEGTRNGFELRHHVGLRFGGLDDNSRRTLQRFVKKDGNAR
jgi:c-di-GMP-binding flagellar brake protein YcgR